MAKKPFTNADFFDFSSLEKQIAKIKEKQAQGKGQNNETIAKNEANDLNNDIRKLLENQLSILQDIQYVLTEIEKNSKKKKRSFLFNKNEPED